jgi:hypothetical protein
MTPQERELVEQLFDRLATLENQPRDPEAERAIRAGLARAPSAIYPLVQTALIQDEALRRANARIEELEAAGGGGEPREQQGGFLDSLRNAMFGQDERRGSGSVPTVRPGEAGRPDDRWGSGRPMGVPPGYGRGPEPGWQGGQGGPGGPFGGAPGGAPGGAFGGGGGSFLGTAAAAAAGVIGGSLLLGAIRNVMTPAHAGQSALDQNAGGDSISPWGGGAADSDLSRQAGADDIGARRTSAYDDSERDAPPDREAAHDGDDADYEDSDYGDDTDII